MSSSSDQKKQSDAKSSIAAARKTLFEHGQAVRSSVTGPAHVQRSWGSVSDFSRPMQELATEAGWGLIWCRDAPGGLDRKTRSLLNVAMLAVLGKSQELGVHVKGAVRNGCSETEIQEALLQAAVYAGLPVGMEGFRVAERALDELKNERDEA